MFVHAESDTAHRYRRLALADFEFQMFLITSHQTGTGIDNSLRRKYRFHISRANRIELFQPMIEIGRYFIKSQLHIDIDLRAGLFQ